MSIHNLQCSKRSRCHQSINTTPGHCNACNHQGRPGPPIPLCPHSWHLSSISFTMVIIQRTMKLGGLKFYGLDGTSTKAQMCNGAIQNWTWFPFLPSPPKVHLDLLTLTMCCVHVIWYFFFLVARSTWKELVSLAVYMMDLTGLSIMWISGWNEVQITVLSH